MIWLRGAAKLPGVQLADRILELLYDRRGRYVWPEDLSASAGRPRPSRAELERALEELAARGHRLERSPVAGVRLVGPTVLEAHLIERALPVEHVGRHVICFREVDSTNDVAFDSARQGPSAPLVVTAEYQRAGRGRLGRSWLSPPGSGVLASVAMGPLGKLGGEALTIAAGLAVAEGIEQATGVAVELEWPNDVLWQGRKLAGVMVEVRGPSREPGGGEVVVGFGINVTAAPPAGQTDRPAACLADAVEDAAALERIEILRAVLVRLDRWVGGIAAGRHQHLHDRWLARCGMLNRRLRVACGGRTHVGRVIDVSPLEGMLLLTDDGRQVHLLAATSTILR